MEVLKRLSTSISLSLPRWLMISGIRPLVTTVKPLSTS